MEGIIEGMSKFYQDMVIKDLKCSKLQDYNKLSYNSILYLELIYLNNGKITASDIANLLNVSKPAIIQKINYLVDEEYIIKEQDKKDKRIFKLFLNPNCLFFIEKRKKEKEVKKMEKKYTKEEIEIYLTIFEDFKKVLIGGNNGNKCT